MEHRPEHHHKLLHSKLLITSRDMTLQTRPLQPVMNLTIWQQRTGGNLTWNEANVHSENGTTQKITMHQFRLIARDLSATWQRRVISISHPIQKRANYSFYFHCRKKKKKKKKTKKKKKKKTKKKKIWQIPSVNHLEAPLNWPRCG